MTARERRRIRANDPVGMRNRVLDAAASSFQANGYAGTGMQDLARGAAISAGALYHHFPTKRDLALAVVAERVSAEIASTWIAAVADAPSAAQGVVSVFEDVAAALDRRGAVSGCPLGNLALELSLADGGLRAAIEGEYRTWRTAVAERVRRDLADGAAGYAAGDPDGFADLVVALFTGAMAIAKAEQSSTALRACARQLRWITGLTVPA